MILGAQPPPPQKKRKKQHITRFDCINFKFGYFCVKQELTHVRGLRVLHWRVCAEDVKKVTILNLATRIVWNINEDIWESRGKDYLTIDKLETIFPNATVIPNMRQPYGGKNIPS